MSTENDLILSVNPGHDGAFAILKDHNLVLSFEGEHDSQPRHWPANAYRLLDVLSRIGDVPGIVATSGWSKGFPFQSAATPYHGTDECLVRLKPSSMVGRETILFESTHERSHIFCAYGLSPFPQGEPCYVLVWEGDIGSFYEIDAKMQIRSHGCILPNPGYKYSFLFDLADPTIQIGSWRLDNAGKLMALAGLADRAKATADEHHMIDRILQEVTPPTTSKELFKDTQYFNCGVTEPRFCNLVARFSDAVFDIFYSYARSHLVKGYPLLIAGGCGLNCEWNSRWRNSELFDAVFVPPVPNDSGCAIGTAIEAQYVVFGSAKISWSVYSGAEFDCEGNGHEFVEGDLDYDRVARLLAQDKVVAWVQGKSEIGPRALGNRSLLASPFKEANRVRLNEIKQREWYRPIAPVCLEEDAGELFGLSGTSPFMLYFQSVCRPELKAVAHVDGSARVQTVNKNQNLALYKLLRAFKGLTGFGVLCNTSLNRKGTGFINRASDLFDFVRERDVDAVVINNRCYLPVFESKRRAVEV